MTYYDNLMDFRYLYNCTNGCWFLRTNLGGGCNKCVCQEIAFFLNMLNLKQGIPRAVELPLTVPEQVLGKVTYIFLNLSKLSVR